MTWGRTVGLMYTVAPILAINQPLCRGARMNLKLHTVVSAKVQPGRRLCVTGEGQPFLLGLGGNCKVGSRAHYQHTTPRNIFLEE